MKNFILILPIIYTINLKAAGFWDTYQINPFYQRFIDGAEYQKDEIVRKWQTTGRKLGIPKRGEEGFYLEETQTSSGATAVNKNDKKSITIKKNYTPEESIEMMSKYFENYKCNTKKDDIRIDFTLNKTYRDKDFSRYQYILWNKEHYDSWSLKAPEVIEAKMSQGDSKLLINNFDYTKLFVLNVFYDCFCRPGYYKLCNRKPQTIKEATKKIVNDLELVNNKDLANNNENEVNQEVRKSKEIIPETPNYKTEAGSAASSK
jgi:hypothetical protein